MAERNLDFDRIINRKNTDCLKYDFAVKRGMPADVLPLWVADMDFETSSYIEDALVERAKMGIYGYSDEIGRASCRESRKTCFPCGWQTWTLRPPVTSRMLWQNR